MQVVGLGDHQLLRLAGAFLVVWLVHGVRHSGWSGAFLFVWLGVVPRVVGSVSGYRPPGSPYWLDRGVVACK